MMKSLLIAVGLPSSVARTGAGLITPIYFEQCPKYFLKYFKHCSKYFQTVFEIFSNTVQNKSKQCSKYVLELRSEVAYIKPFDGF